MKTGIQIRDDVKNLSGDELVRYIVRLRNEAFKECRAMCCERYDFSRCVEPRIANFGHEEARKYTKI